MLVMPFLHPEHVMASTILVASFTLPKITCLPSNYSVLALQIKN